jgi:hypothetical protein
MPRIWEEDIGFLDLSFFKYLSNLLCISLEKNKVFPSELFCFFTRFVDTFELYFHTDEVYLRVFLDLMRKKVSKTCSDFEIDRTIVSEKSIPFSEML